MYIGESLENMHQYSTCKQDYLGSFLLSPLTFFQVWKTSVYYFDSDKKLAISLLGEKKSVWSLNWFHSSLINWLLGDWYEHS